MKEFEFSVPQKVIAGVGSIARLPQVVSGFKAKKVLLMTGPHLAKMPVMEIIKKQLGEGGMECCVFSEIEANPSVETAEKALQKYKEEHCDAIVALGGGSPMDAAKAVAAAAKYGGKITDYEGAGKVPGKTEPLIAIPTTAGTGSETTAFAVITDHSRNYKFTIASENIIPDAAILDASLLASMPASVAAASGIDAFIHAEESYVSKKASPFTEVMSEKAMELIGRNIRAFTADRTNLEAAEGMLLGSLFAGIAFSWANLGIVHAMSHPVSAYFNVAHGVANAILLPEAVRFNSLADVGKYHKIYNYIAREPFWGPEFCPEYLAEEFEELNEELGIPANLSLVGVKPEYLDVMAADAMKSGNIKVNPRSISLSDVIRLYERSMGG